MTLRTCEASVRYRRAISGADISVADANKIIARTRVQRCLAPVESRFSRWASCADSGRTNTSGGRTTTSTIAIRPHSPPQRRFRSNVQARATSAEESEGGWLDSEIRPVERDPPDVVARTIRALWKIALGCLWLAREREALDPSWDDPRQAVLPALPTRSRSSRLGCPAWR